MVLFGLIILGVLTAWLVLGPAFLPALPKKELSKKIACRAGEFTKEGVEWISGVRSSWRGEQDLGLRLKSWVQNMDLDRLADLSQPEARLLRTFRVWITLRSDLEAGKIAAELNAFCAKQGVALEWLLEEGSKAEIQQALTALVLFYGLAVRERIEARPLAVLRSWQSAPFSRDQRAFGNLLYVQLVKAGLCTTPAELVFVPEKKWYEHFVDSIRAANEIDRTAVLACTERVLEIQGSGAG